jgi:hypothetical protein
MNQEDSRIQSLEKTTHHWQLASLGGIICLVLIVMLFTSSRTTVNLPPLDPITNCSDYGCLTTCLSQLPDLVPELDPGMWSATEKLQEGAKLFPLPPGVYDIANYYVNGDEITLSKNFEIPERLLSLRNNTVLHQNVWNYFISIIPRDVRMVLTSYVIFTDGANGNVAAAVDYYKPYNYQIYVDLYDLDDENDLTYALVHETGHLVSINPDQIRYVSLPMDRRIFLLEEERCGAFFDGYYCSKPDSYLNAFYKKFWKGRHDEWVDIFLAANTEERDQLIEDFYWKFPDEFYNSYAASKPIEDFAVSFEHFVLEKKPTTNLIVDKKVLFFYKYHEFVELRDQIIKGICRYTATP